MIPTECESGVRVIHVRTNRLGSIVHRRDMGCWIDLSFGDHHAFYVFVQWDSNFEDLAVEMDDVALASQL